MGTAVTKNIGRNYYETAKRQVTAAPVNVDLSGTSARSTQLAVGDYYVRALVDCYIRQGNSAVTAVTTDYPLLAGEEIVIHVDDATANGYLAGITSGASLTAGLRIKAVEAV